MALYNSTSWRTSRLYNEKLDQLLEGHLPELKAIFSGACKKMKMALEKDQLLLGQEWERLLTKHKIIGDSFTIQDARCDPPHWLQLNARITRLTIVLCSTGVVSVGRECGARQN
jgi:hypothetical protein